jgi:hypothetical protein
MKCSQKTLTESVSFVKITHVTKPTVLKQSPLMWHCKPAYFVTDVESSIGRVFEALRMMGYEFGIALCSLLTDKGPSGVSGLHAPVSKLQLYISAM